LKRKSQEKVLVKKKDNMEDERDAKMMFRYKFTDACMEELNAFAKLHQYDDRHDFKEAWTEWTESQEELILSETERLNQLGYSGDVLDKMFKSARYYFRKKPLVVTVPKERKKYDKADRDILESIDNHVQEHLREKPSAGFLDFCEKHPEVDKDDSKVKKTYKNRHYSASLKL
jgi:hypothetical protein